MEPGSTHVSPTCTASFPDHMLEYGNEDKAATEPNKMWVQFQLVLAKCYEITFSAHTISRCGLEACSCTPGGALFHAYTSLPLLPPPFPLVPFWVVWLPQWSSRCETKSTLLGCCRWPCLSSPVTRGRSGTPSSHTENPTTKGYMRTRESFWWGAGSLSTRWSLRRNLLPPPPEPAQMKTCGRKNTEKKDLVSMAGPPLGAGWSICHMKCLPHVLRSHWRAQTMRYIPREYFPPSSQTQTSDLRHSACTMTSQRWNRLPQNRAHWTVVHSKERQRIF